MRRVISFNGTPIMSFGDEFIEQPKRINLKPVAVLVTVILGLSLVSFLLA